jgi:hypothetical protein
LLLECKFDRKLREHEVFNRIRKALDSAKSTMSKVINVDNHGISVGHVKELFCPLGLDLPDDPSSLASLDKLAKRRGEKAHKGVGATVVVAAGDAKKMVGDCLVVAKQIGVTAEGLQV